MLNQHVSFSGTRTTLVPQDRIACTDAESDGPSKMPHPCAQAYSVPERFTPRSRTARPAESTSWFPCTRTVGAPCGGGGGGGPLPFPVVLRHAVSTPVVSSTRTRMRAKLNIGPDSRRAVRHVARSEEHTSELQSRLHLVCRLLLEKKKKTP